MVEGGRPGGGAAGGSSRGGPGSDLGPEAEEQQHPALVAPLVEGDVGPILFGVLWVKFGLIFMEKIVVRLRLVSPFVHDEQLVVLLRVLPTCVQVDLVPLPPHIFFSIFLV